MSSGISPTVGLSGASSDQYLGLFNETSNGDVLWLHSIDKIGFVFYWRHKKVKEVLEEWEIQYGPHRFAYKELFNATKGFKEKQLLGRGERLTWEQRFKIIKDVASALLHLHQEWAQVIIHRDIKPANVLIDHDMNARLGDFRLAKLYDQGFDPQTSRVAGTLGYIAPEFIRTGRATTSTDVYAFGLVMLEIVCGRRLIDRRAEENEEVLVDWILELWEHGNIFDAAEESTRQEQNRGEIELVLKLGVLCAHQSESIRPDMSVGYADLEWCCAASR
ncbi:hypothetical protein ARALYDRAFT_907487 [Arabidopsis lyrata subsp. lyrata]|uniref:non-specific serine/threonine protein kinase n=1 Tax=Arabidopsis lyrata subsp. lyrata TaxID=81972 RepID=D7LWG6_ARALL|nr:hypothetical protein ARALYDRAFT_907487 [Arabidopsis lyrata subsp. lyrata]